MLVIFLTAVNKLLMSKQHMYFTSSTLKSFTKFANVNESFTQTLNTFPRPAVIFSRLSIPYL